MNYHYFDFIQKRKKTLTEKLRDIRLKKEEKVLFFEKIQNLDSLVEAYNSKTEKSNNNYKNNAFFNSSEINKGNVKKRKHYRK